MIEKLHFLHNEFCRANMGEPPSAILMHPQDWYTAIHEAYQTGAAGPTGSLGEKTQKFRGIKVYRTMDLEPGEIKMLR